MAVHTQTYMQQRADILILKGSMRRYLYWGKEQPIGGARLQAVMYELSQSCGLHASRALGQKITVVNMRETIVSYSQKFGMADLHASDCRGS